MFIILKYIVISLFFGAMYGLFGSMINAGIIWLTTTITSLGCIVPTQIIRLLLFTIISLIIKAFLKIIK